MLGVTQLIGFGDSLLIGGTLGSALTVSSYIGNMTSNGGNAGAFDGTTSQSFVDCAARTSATNAFVGADLSAAPKRIFKAETYGSNNSGWVGSANPTISLTLWGKQTSPSTYSDGTQLCDTLSFSDNTTIKTLTVYDAQNKTQWNYVWLGITHNGSANLMYCAELTLYESV